MTVASTPLPGWEAFLRDILYYLHAALIEKIAHLLGDLVPSTSWIVVEDQPDYGQQKNERSKGKNCVVGERGSKLWSFIFKPFLKRLLQERHRDAQK